MSDQNLNKRKKEHCLICKKKFFRDETPSWPFCSDKCKLLDLGKWLGGDYFVQGEEHVIEDGSED